MSTHLEARSPNRPVGALIVGVTSFVLIVVGGSVIDRWVGVDSAAPTCGHTANAETPAGGSR